VKSRKRLVVAVLLFCAGMSLFMRVLDFGVRRSTLMQTWKVNQIASHARDPEIMVFGSSVGEVAVDPSILEQATGCTAFNCCIDGTPFAQYKGLIDEFVSYRVTNRCVVLVETYFSFTRVESLNEIGRYAAHLSNPNIYRSLAAVQPGLAWKCRYVPFYKLVAVSHVYYKDAAIGWINWSKGAGLAGSGGGYYPVAGSWEAGQDEELLKRKFFNIEIDKEIVNAYRDTVSKLAQDGRRVVLVLPPFYRDVSAKITDFTPIRESLAAFSSCSNVVFMDFSLGELGSHKEYFYNAHHLNRTGAQLFSQELGANLAKLGVINPSRTGLSRN
jgi:hypothetical protein